MSIDVFCLSGIRSDAWVFEENYENGQFVQDKLAHYIYKVF